MHYRKIIGKITALALSATLAFVLAACGEEAEPAPVQEQEESEDYEDTSKEESYEEADYDEDDEEEPEEEYEEVNYITIYRELVNEMADSGMADQFMLATIDRDEIPELLASHSDEPYDQENTFIYTVYDNEPVLLASVIAGVDGASLSYSDKNMIRQTGSLAGMADVYSKIVDGELEEVFRAEMVTGFETDDDGDEVITYLVNEEEVSEKEYEKQLATFNEEYAPFVGIDYDGLSIMEFKNGQFEVMHQMAYWTLEDTMDMLDAYEADYEDEDEREMNTLALVGPEYTGLTSLREDDYSDGSYFYEDMTDDGITIITNMCYPNSQRDGQAPDAYAENLVCAQVDNDAVIDKSAEDPKLSEKLTYPVYRISWESGSNEDTKQAIGVVVLTDNYTFYFGYKCPIDYFEENADFYDEELEDIDLVDFAE